MIGTHDDPHSLIISSGDRPVRRRWIALAVILSVALAGALLGQMSVVRNDASRPTPPGPFSQLPH
ncbi:hypothetical protein [Phenylobacterium sp.]|uniref:hypothetical protein n=1 Tax=Phenylobacterium sp. TaxID=1871053 RepID=UPI0027357355|nr:hypothetical protein [Phenylobacterium sp.]MDP1601309.1 hypothetical protein [Phenylobacterium sp.]MDP3591667.1 hypothetical protein [Phenylobacterium sp.]